MLQAKEFSKDIVEWIRQSYVKINTSIEKGFKEFMKDDDNKEWWKMSSLSWSSFEYQYNNLKNLVYSAERGEIWKVEEYKEKLYAFLLRASRIWGISIDSISTERENEDEVDFIEIVKAKNIIIREIEKTTDEQYLKILEGLILYYTQFWRILEMYGDIYADLEILLDERFMRELYDRYLDNRVCFQRDNPCIYLLNNERKDFKDIKGSQNKQAMLLLYTILKNPLESFEAIQWLYQVNKSKFNMQTWDVSLKTLKYFYFSRLNSYLNLNLKGFICRKNGKGFYIEKVC